MFKLYNTLTKSKEVFKSLHTGKVGMYTCGPTVYGYIHIGNIRSYMTADILRRYLEYQGYEVRSIKNITDVGHLTEDDIAQADSGEDKILKKALKEKKSPQEIAEFYEDYFKNTEKEMNILPAHYFPKATTHINQMIKIISGLIKNGYAYEKNGNVFFDVTKFSGYGKLSGNTLENLKSCARLEKHPDKKNSWDFALWLKASAEHLMKWKSPWSTGYPGWHIECSAMSLEYLGETLDIHTGGEDNIFPHHEAEIAQSEKFTGKKFVNYWIHTRHLLVDGKKMSKSKENFYVLEDIKEKGFNAMELRLLLLSSHYRSPLNFTWDSIKQAKQNFKRITEFIQGLDKKASLKNSSSDWLKKYQEKFEFAMDDDLNTPLALSILYNLITETNKLISQEKMDEKTAAGILSLWNKMNKVFGLTITVADFALAEIPAGIKNLAREREQARQAKNFQKSDGLRELIRKKGYEIKDKKEGYKIRKV